MTVGLTQHKGHRHGLPEWPDDPAALDCTVDLLAGSGHLGEPQQVMKP
jgi:hypothetical protein